MFADSNLTLVSQTLYPAWRNMLATGHMQDQPVGFEITPWCQRETSNHLFVNMKIVDG